MFISTRKELGPDRRASDVHGAAGLMLDDVVAATATLASQEPAHPTKHGVRVIMILSILLGFASISTDLYLPAMPAMGRSLNADAGSYRADDLWLLDRFQPRPIAVGADWRPLWPSRAGGSRPRAVHHRFGRLRAFGQRRDVGELARGTGDRRVRQCGARPRHGA